MNSDKRFINNQEENIYTFDELLNEDDINNKMYAFFNELVKRRRNDPLEGGLQACVIIFKDKCAMKICENDGNAPHANAFINLVKHLNGDYKYISVSGTSNFMISQAERNQLAERGIEISILDGEDELKLSIISKIKELSKYQADMLNKLLFSLKELKDNKTYNSVSVGFYIAGLEIPFNELDDDHYNNILDGINNLKVDSLGI